MSRVWQRVGAPPLWQQLGPSMGQLRFTDCSNLSLARWATGSRSGALPALPGGYRQARPAQLTLLQGTAGSQSKRPLLCIQAVPVAWAPLNMCPHLSSGLAADADALPTASILFLRQTASKQCGQHTATCGAQIGCQRAASTLQLQLLACRAFQGESHFLNAGHDLLSQWHDRFYPPSGAPGSCLTLHDLESQQQVSTMSVSI